MDDYLQGLMIRIIISRLKLMHLCVRLWTVSHEFISDRVQVVVVSTDTYHHFTYNPRSSFATTSDTAPQFHLPR